MPRGPRSTFEEYNLFHAYSRGVDRMAISRDDADRIAWVSLLERTIDRFELGLKAYCLMPNHFHLVAEAPLPDLSGGMHWLNGLYAQRFNRRHDRTGHLFQGRFGLRVVKDETGLVDTCEYVRANPVRAGLCSCVEDWPWSGISY